MSTNVSSTRTLGPSLIAAAVLAVFAGFASASQSGSAWSPPPPVVHDGVCARACEVAACISFGGDTPEVTQVCALEAAAQFRDMRRAGPDRACVQRCEQDGAPVDLALLWAPESALLGSR